jgi:hypothetical protein
LSEDLEAVAIYQSSHQVEVVLNFVRQPLFLRLVGNVCGGGVLDGGCQFRLDEGCTEVDKARSGENGEDAVNLRRTNEELDEINDKIRIRFSDGTRRLWARLRRWRRLVAGRGQRLSLNSVMGIRR